MIPGVKGPMVRPAIESPSGSLKTSPPTTHLCNRAQCCERFDDAVLHGYVRNDAYDMTVIQEIYAGEQQQNEGNRAMAVTMTEV
jgi:hypothetical protein